MASLSFAGVKSGDAQRSRITFSLRRLDIPKRSIDMLVDDAELARRQALWKQPEAKAGRGYGWMFAQHIEQADTGCDFEFLKRSFGASASEPDIY
jgi:hypothetical protein